MKDWERRLATFANDCICKDRFDILGLYLKLSNTAGDWIAQRKHHIKAGDSFNVPCENKNILEFTFFEKTCELKLINPKTKDNTILISKDDSAAQEYKTIEKIAEAFKVSNQGLGRSRPPQMAALVTKMNVGDCLSFEERNTYLCIDKHDSTMSFLKVFCGNINTFTADKLNNIEKITIDIYSEYDWQNFYSQNRLSAYGLIMPTLSESTAAQQYINKLRGLVKEHHTKQLQWGNFNVLVRKKRIGKGLVWYIDGKKVDESTIKLLYGYFNNNPKEINYIRTERDEIKDFEDMECKRHLTQLEAQFQYADMFYYLCDYVSENQSSLKVDIKTFKPDAEGNFIAQKFAFQFENGKTKVYSITFENNDFANEINTIKEIDVNEFATFCAEVHRHNKVLCWDEQRESLRAQFSLNQLTPIQDKIAENMADKQVQKTSVIQNIKTDNTLEDIIKGYSNVSERREPHEPETNIDFFNIDR